MNIDENGDGVHETAEGLPSLCYALLPSSGLAMIIKRGVRGYWAVDCVAKEHAAQFVEDRNRRMGVTPAQREAMQCGSIFGWDTPAADPAAYSEVGGRAAT